MIGGRARDSAAVGASAAAFRPICDPHEQFTPWVAQATRVWFRATRPKPLSGKLPGSNGQVARATTCCGFAASRLCAKSALCSPQFRATPVFAPLPSRHACLLLTPNRLACKCGMSREKCRKIRKPPVIEPGLRPVGLPLAFATTRNEKKKSGIYACFPASGSVKIACQDKLYKKYRK